MLKFSGFSRQPDYRHYLIALKGAEYFRASALRADLPTLIYTFAL